MAITHVKIHPAIGIARVGNSPDEWFVGPETADMPPVPAGGYKDAQCRVKRQGARFRVFAYHDDGTPPTELTAADADITWTVELANRKAAAPARNPTVTGADRDKLVIAPGAETLTGPNGQATFTGGAIEFPSFSAVTVPLGEIRTDTDGRLVVLGGFGRSTTPTGAPLVDFLNNNGWHDDVADGPVSASVVVGPTTFTAEGAWVIVAPPKFATTVRPAITLHDRLHQHFRTNGMFGFGLPNPIEFRRHVYPILNAAVQYRGVHQGAGSAHSTLAQSLFPLDTAQKTAVLAKLKQEGGNMPLLSGSAQLTATQYEMLQRWRDDDPTFVDDWASAPTVLALTPDELDRGPLWHSIGAAFFPGIEAGDFLVGSTTIWGDAFRLDHGQVDPGDVTQTMACPWQADFYACSSNWWPSHRPHETVEQSTGTYHAWASTISGYQSMVDNWHTLGFVVPQGADLVEVEACAVPFITLLTPLLDFVDVPQGPGGVAVSRALPVSFEVESPGVAATFSIVGGANTAPFSRVTLTDVAVGPTGAVPELARLWIRYTTEAVNSTASSTVTVEHVESGRQWVIDLRGNTVARTTTAVALVLDTSGSMNESRGDGATKMASLQQAAAMFVDLAQEDDGIGAVAFHHDVAGEIAVSALGSILDPFDPGRTAAKAFVGGLTPGGATSVGDGLERGRQLVTAASGYDRTAMVVITDGKENNPKWIADVAGAIDATTYGVGIGTAANIDAGTLQTLTGNHGGYLLVTGAIAGDNQFVLMKYFLQILAGISNAEVILDPSGNLGRGDEIRIPFTVSDADLMIDVILLSPAHPFMEFRIETPLGRVLYPAGGHAEHVVSDDARMLRFRLPVEIDPGRIDHAGEWNVVLSITDRPPKGFDRERWKRLAELRREYLQILDPRNEGRATVPYSVIVQAHSDVALRATARQSGQMPGATVTIDAWLTHFGAPFEGTAGAWVELTTPSGTTDRLVLDPTGSGRFSGELTTGATGVYGMRIRAAGRTPAGWRFDREQTLTATVAHPGGITDPRDRDRDAARLCELLDCVMHVAGASEGLRRRLVELGIDFDHLVQCVRQWCRDRRVPDDESPNDGIPKDGIFVRTGTGPVELDPDVLGELVRLVERIRRP